jgi:hypothetical protein
MSRRSFGSARFLFAIWWSVGSALRIWSRSGRLVLLMLGRSKIDFDGVNDMRGCFLHDAISRAMYYMRTDTRIAMYYMVTDT